jgi:hypothetical protein
MTTTSRKPITPPTAAPVAASMTKTPSFVD